MIDSKDSAMHLYSFIFLPKKLLNCHNSLLAHWYSILASKIKQLKMDMFFALLSAACGLAIVFSCLFGIWYGLTSATTIVACTVNMSSLCSPVSDLQAFAAGVVAMIMIIIAALTREHYTKDVVKEEQARRPPNEPHPAKRLLKFLDNIPQHLKVGRWSPVAHLVIVAYCGFLLLSMHHASSLYDPAAYGSEGESLNSRQWLQLYRLFGGLYGVYVVVDTIVGVGVWPLMSYTVTSWNLMTLRLLTAFVAGYQGGNSSWTLVADMLRFPALIGCTITVCIWWLVLVPMIHHLLRADAASQRFFWVWSSSFRLINLHLVNLPLVAGEFLLSGHKMTFFDLWMAMAVAFLYVLFYLNILDANGFHFYIVFTPRTHYCVFTYGAVILLYWGLHALWNMAVL